MKTIITVLATATASAFVYDVNAQSLEQGKKYLTYERFGSAEKELSGLANSSPEANYYYGLSILGKGNIVEAKNIFAKHPNDFRNIAGTARVLYAEGNGDEAFKLVQGIVDGAKKKDWEKYKIAADAIAYSKKSNQNDAAIDWYRIANERKAKNPEILIALGDALLRENTGESNGEAVKMFDAVIEEGSQKSLAYSRKGLIWMNARSYTAALEEYNHAKETDSQNPLPYGDLADVYYLSGKYELAKKNIEEYLKLSDKSVKDQMRYGNILYLTKNFEQSEEVFQALVDAGEAVKSPQLYRALAFNQYQSKKHEEALANFEKYRSTVKDTKDLTWEDYFYHGALFVASAKENENALEKAELYRKGDEYFNKALELNKEKDQTELYRNITDAYKETKDWAKVAEWYNNLVVKYPESSELDYFYSGYYSYFAKDFTNAKAKLEAFNTKFPKENLGYFWLGRVGAAQDAEAKLGTGSDAFKTWLSRPLKDSTEVRKPEDVGFALQYLMFVAYNKQNAKDATEYANQILATDPENSQAKQVKEFFKNKK